MKDRFRGLIEKAKKQYVPSVEQEKRFKDITKGILSRIKIPGASTSVGGSGAKGTWLADGMDIDIYVVFSRKKYLGKDISIILEKELKKSGLRYQKLHGSRDYFQVQQNGCTVEIVPIMEIKKINEAENITDYSPMHVAYVRKYKRYADDIRIAKKFLKGAGVYGAESYIRGFSGYVVELLIIKYKGFLNFGKDVSKWKERTIIGDKKRALKLNKSKIQSPLILLDPVQPERNAAAAVSEEAYEKLVRHCKKFLASPSLRFFEEKHLDVTELIKKNMVVVEGELIKKQKDIGGAKALKALEMIDRILREQGFQIKKNLFEIREGIAILAFLFDKPATKPWKQFGPNKKFEKELDRFIKLHSGEKIFYDRRRPYIIREPEETDPKKAIAKIIPMLDERGLLKDARIVN